MIIWIAIAFVFLFAMWRMNLRRATMASPVGTSGPSSAGLFKSNKFTMIWIAVLVVFMILMWFGFMRQVPMLQAEGTVSDVGFKAAGTTSVNVYYGGSRGFRTPVTVPTGSGYLVTINTSGFGEVTYFENSPELLKSGFAQGDRVNLKYQKKGFPPVWTKILVLEVVKL